MENVLNLIMLKLIIILKLNLFDSINLGNSLKQIIQQINGQYTFIIHNESYSEKDGWKGWRTTFNSWASTI